MSIERCILVLKVMYSSTSGCIQVHNVHLECAEMPDPDANESTPKADALSGPLLSAGFVIDQTYEIISLLGHGGMCSVYLSRHRGLDREVALKILRPDLAVDQ